MLTQVNIANERFDVSCVLNVFWCDPRVLEVLGPELVEFMGIIRCQERRAIPLIERDDAHPNVDVPIVLTRRGRFQILNLVQLACWVSQEENLCRYRWKD